jgi:nucleotide-binding universal stress UspA family protein
MYKHILVPTDGSRLAGRGVRQGLNLAKALRARVRAVYVASPYTPPIYNKAAIYYAGQVSRAAYRKALEKTAGDALGAVERAARAAGVACSRRLVMDPQAWRGIIRSARAGRCDLIVMASHGRGAVGGLVLGSETSRVLAHSKIPVLVVRA